MSNPKCYLEECRVTAAKLETAIELMRQLLVVHAQRNEFNLISTSPEAAKKAWDAVRDFVKETADG